MGFLKNDFGGFWRIFDDSGLNHEYFLKDLDDFGRNDVVL